MTQMTFSFEEIEALAQERFTHPHLFVRRKMEAVLLKTANLPHQTICRLCGICGNTLRSYWLNTKKGVWRSSQKCIFTVRQVSWRNTGSWSSRNWRCTRWRRSSKPGTGSWS